MACECATTCKANLLEKKTAYLTLINSLSLSGVTQSRMSNIISYILDDMNRLHSLIGRIDNLQSEMAWEASINSENYMSSIVKNSITQELTALKVSSPEDYLVLSSITGIVIPDPEEENGLPE